MFTDKAASSILTGSKMNFAFGGMTVYRSELLASYKTVNRRVPGGYKFRWLIRIQEQIRVQNIFISEAQRAVYCDPLSYEELTRAALKIPLDTPFGTTI